MLTALAVLLMAERILGKSTLRVVYIPDCHKLVSSPVRTMQTALTAAFADSDQECAQLEQAASQDKLGRFCALQRVGTMVFLLDNFNALPMVTGRTGVTAEQKAEVNFLELCGLNHFQVQVTSINDVNKDDILKKQLSVARLSFYGGLTVVSYTETYSAAVVGGCDAPCVSLWSWYCSCDDL
jgi:hypothetical protein